MVPFGTMYIVGLTGGREMGGSQTIPIIISGALFNVFVHNAFFIFQTNLVHHSTPPLTTGVVGCLTSDKFNLPYMLVS